MKIANLDDVTLLKIFIALRDRRSKRKTSYQAEDEDDRTMQDKIEIEFLRRFGRRGIDNVSAHGVGTAYKSSRFSATVADWDSFLGHVQYNNAWELLERRVNKTAVAQFMAVNNDLPPGVNWSETQVINFRRK